MTAVSHNTSSMSEILKRTYTGWVDRALNNNWIVLRRMRKNSKKVRLGAGGLYWDVNYGRPNVRAGTETGALPDADTPDYQQVTQQITHQYGVIRWSEWLLNQNNKEAFVTGLHEAMKRFVEAHSADIARQIMGEGQSIVTRLSAASNGANPTLYVDTPVVCDVGMQIDVVNPADYATRLTVGTYLEVTGRSLGDGTVSTTGGTLASTAEDDIVLRYGANSGTTSYEMVSLQEICADDSTLHGLDVANHPWWKAHEVENSEGIEEFNEAKLHELIDNIVSDCGECPTVLYMPYGVKRAIVSQMKTQRRYVNKTKMDSGGKTVAFETEHGLIPMISDRHAGANTLQAINEKHIGWDSRSRGGPRWLGSGRAGGDILFRVSGYALWESVLISNPQMVTFMRNCHGKLTNIRHG